MMALADVELETLVSEPNALATRPPPCANKVIFDYLINSQFKYTVFDYLLNSEFMYTVFDYLINSQFKFIFFDYLLNSQK